MKTSNSSNQISRAKVRKVLDQKLGRHAELARRAGVSRQTVLQWLKGSVSNNVATKAAEYLAELAATKTSKAA